MTSVNSGPLSGVKVLDMSRILAGPFAGQLLADFGAEVIKIERPGSGDDTRQWGPPQMPSVEGSDLGAAYFHAANRNKASMAIDISKPEGQQIIRQLLTDCDVLIENYKVDGLKKYGLDYQSLKDEFSGLIYCSITGFGQTGPYRHRAGYDFLLQGMGGLMSVTGEPDGMPVKVGVALVDILTGLYASNAIQAALHHRAHSGEGQHIDLSLLDVQVASLANQASNYLATGRAPSRLGNAHPNIVPYQAFAAADGHLILAVGNDKQFQAFCQVAKLEVLAADERYSSNQARVQNREALVEIIANCLVEQPRDYWLAEFEKLGVPCGPINDIAQVFADPQILARQMQIELPTTDGERAASVANPVRFSKTPVQYQRAAPKLGEDTQQQLAKLGLSSEQIEGLVASGLIQTD